jgi:hypothetical protein
MDWNHFHRFCSSKRPFNNALYRIAGTAGNKRNRSSRNTSSMRQKNVTRISIAAAQTAPPFGCQKQKMKRKMEQIVNKTTPETSVFQLLPLLRHRNNSVCRF